MCTPKEIDEAQEQLDLEAAAEAAEAEAEAEQAAQETNETLEQS